MFLARLIGSRKKTRSAGSKASEKHPSEMAGFDRTFYLARNPDVASSGMDPLKHYLEHGWREGREPSAGFNGQRYLALNPDVGASNMNPLVHYLKHGLAEGRSGAYDAPGASEAGGSPIAEVPARIGAVMEVTRLVPGAPMRRDEPTRLL